jgi:hypothetical protein
MEPLDDYPISNDRALLTSTPVRERSGRAWAVAAVGLIVVAALVAFFVVRPSDAPTGNAAPARSASQASAERQPLGPPVEARELPPLDLTDPIVRELLSGLSSRPELAAWLATDGLIRNFVASVDAIANGGTPTSHLRRLAPAQPFAVRPMGNVFHIDPRSYQRYDGIADTVAALDAGGLARAYSTLRPRLQDAYRELGYPDANFDSAVERAIAQLLDTPMPNESMQVQPSPVLYQFVDPRVERLAPAQKQLLRMGPRNVELVQGKLRELSRALGALPPT